MAELYWSYAFNDYAADCAECGKPIRVCIDYCTDYGYAESAQGGAPCDFCDNYVHIGCLPEITSTGCCTKCGEKYFTANGERNEVRIA